VLGEKNESTEHTSSRGNKTVP